MNKKAIKEFATWARTELIERVKLRAERFGIVDDNAEPKLDSFRGYVFSDVEKKQRRTLAEKIARDGYENVMEEVAYTWFNRFCALRFMEVNEYLPSRVRVFTDSENNFKPQIVDEVRMVDLEGLDLDVVFDFQNKNDDEGLFKYLIITQCNALNAVLPGMFQKIDDYTELLFPDNLRREESVVGKMIAMIPINDWKDQVQIVGWLYQYYIYEKHEEVVDALHGKIIKKDEIPAATQLFTPDWVVRYVVDNTVGRYWLERNPKSKLLNSLEYFAAHKDGSWPLVDETIKPQELTVFDPCVGSGHMIVYAFDVLMNVYREAGYSDSEAAVEIVKNNLYGLDIDDRAAQLAYFGVMMKGRQYDKRFLKRGVQPNVFAIKETEEISEDVFEAFCKRRPDFTKGITALRQSLKNARETGALAHVSNVELDVILRSSEINEPPFADLKSMCKAASTICQRYCAVVTNPPYMNKFDAALKEYVNKNYKAFSSDLFSAVVYRCFDFCKENAYSGFMSPYVWMFIKSYEDLRQYVLSQKQIVSLIQMEYSAFEEAIVPLCSYVLQNRPACNKGLYFRLTEFKGGMEVQHTKYLEAINNKYCSYFYETSQENFSKIPGAPIAYWWKTFSLFELKKVGNYYESAGRNKTHDNNLYLRCWWEISDRNRWQPYANGGQFRKWAGNDLDLVDWSAKAKDFYASHGGLYNQKYNGRQGICWNLITSYKNGFRIKPFTHHYSSGAPTIVAINNNHDLLLLGYLNSIVATTILKIFNPTLNTTVGDALNLPFQIASEVEISKLVENSILLSQNDWNSYETSWDFHIHPLIKQNTNRLEKAYNRWESECSERFSQLKTNEETLNKIFIEIYGLKDDLTPEVDDKDVTVRKADKERDVKSLISYAVGCMFGRYSLDKQGLIYAGGDWDASQYKTFQADPDNVLPITDDDRFEDDVANRFFEFVRKVYGAETLEENLKFIADALGGSGSPREIIRNYFLNGFYADHVKIYQKRPIYWLFDSGKKNGFKCLIYMHRYAPDQLARIRTDYIHKLQQIYRRELDEIDDHLNATDEPKVVRALEKKRAKLTAQAEEVRKYEEKIHHLADQKIAIDLDDGVKVNYAKFQNVLAPIK